MCNPGRGAWEIQAPLFTAQLWIGTEGHLLRSCIPPVVGGCLFTPLPGLPWTILHWAYCFFCHAISPSTHSCAYWTSRPQHVKNFVKDFGFWSTHFLHPQQPVIFQMASLCRHWAGQLSGTSFPTVTFLQWLLLTPQQPSTAIFCSGGYHR